MVNAVEQGRYVEQYDMPREIKKVERKVTKTGVKDLLDKFQKKATRKGSPVGWSPWRWTTDLKAKDNVKGREEVIFKHTNIAKRSMYPKLELEKIKRKLIKT